MGKFYILIIIPFLLFTPLNAQQENDQINKELQELKKKVEKLEQAKKKQNQEDELKKLLEAASDFGSKKKTETSNLGKKFKSGTRQQSGMNPNISFGGDFFSSISSSKDDFVTNPSDVSYGNNRFALREVELSINSALDPFTRGKTHISFTEDAICVEEAYLEWLNLPANMNLKMGLFNAEYGILNRYHDHALPQFDRPKVLVNMFSNASVGGFGLAGNFLLPRLLFSESSTLDATVLQGGNGYSFTNEGKYNLQYVGNLTNYYDINDDTYFEVRLSGVAGNNDSAEEYMSYVGDLAFTVKWAPLNRAKYRTIDWKTEILFSNRETPTGDITTKGFYTSLQNKLNSRYWVSGRFGYSELPFDSDQHEWDITATLDFWQSEFVFLRMQYQYSNRDDFTDYASFDNMNYPTEHTILFQVNWAMGPHKHEAY